MTDARKQKLIYNALKEVYVDGAYCGIALDRTLREIGDDKDKAYVTALFYDVLDRDVKLSYYINYLCDKKPKTAVAIIIKMGMCLIIGGTPAYAAVGGAVELAKAVGKRDSAGFINAVLRKYASADIPLPKEEAAKLSVESSTPLWITREAIDNFGLSKASEILLAPSVKKTHVRPNLRRMSYDDFYAKCGKVDKTDYGALMSAKEISRLNKGEYAIMSLSSAIAVNYYRAGLAAKGKILDVCAAPGGKSVYLSELGDYDITACDIHPHRVGLIDAYGASMGAKIKTAVNDGTVYREEWKDAFDGVICDVPCSGIGVRSDKPDVFLNRKEEDIAAIIGIQRKILAVSARYVKRGGTLFYSTCTILKSENDEVAKDFVASNPDFEVLPLKTGSYSSDEDGFLRLLPDGKGTEGFFVAAFKRKE